MLCVSACKRESPRPSPQRQAPAAPAIPDDPQVSHDIATELSNAFQREAVTAVANGATVRVLDHTITAHGGIDSVEAVSDDATVAALAVSLDIDGRSEPAFHVTSIAHDRNRNEAIAHAVREWSVAFAMPFVRALRNAPTDAHVANYRLYPGPIGARGEVPPDWDAQSSHIASELVGRLDGAADELLALPEGQRASDRPFHAIRFTVHVQGGTGVEGDCRVDNVPNERATALIRSYPWPRAAGETNGYIVKQYLLLAR